MRVLLDECMPQRLRHDLAQHEVRTAPEMGWAGKQDGELLRLAAAQFDVFVTTDQRLSYQQNIAAFDLAVIVLIARRNELEFLRPLVPDLLRALVGAQAGQVRHVGG
jgi:predicted nuclease of predicted toxin-antitoxin system